MGTSFHNSVRKPEQRPGTPISKAHHGRTVFRRDGSDRMGSSETVVLGCNDDIPNGPEMECAMVTCSHPQEEIRARKR